MKKNILSALIFLIQFLLVAQAASADVQNGLLITDIRISKEVYVDMPVDFSVGVIDVNTDTGEIGKLENASVAKDAEVIATFEKNGRKIVINLEEGDNGRYVGTVSFPSAEEWQLTVVAKSKNASLSASDAHQNVQNETISVSEAEIVDVPRAVIWVIVFLLAAVWLYYIGRKKRQEKYSVKKRG